MSARQGRGNRLSATVREWFPHHGRIIRPCPDVGKTGAEKTDVTTIVAVGAIN